LQRHINTIGKNALLFPNDFRPELMWRLRASFFSGSPPHHRSHSLEMIDAGHGHQPRAGLILTRQRLDLAGETINTRIKAFDPLAGLTGCGGRSTAGPFH